MRLSIAIPTQLFVWAAVLLVIWGGAFAIALGVSAWRNDQPDLAPLQATVDSLQADVQALPRVNVRECAGAVIRLGNAYDTVLKLVLQFGIVNLPQAVPPPEEIERQLNGLGASPPIHIYAEAQQAVAASC